MTRLALINPLDQPTDRKRLLGQLKEALADRHFSGFKIIVAFAKVGPLLRLKPSIDAARERGLRIEAIFGIDHQGTSAEALLFALDSFDRAYVTRERGLTFHPKIYALQGRSAARVFVGSNNLTVGGTETNFEAAVRIDFDLPNDAANLKPFTDCWEELLPQQCPATSVLDAGRLAGWVGDGTVLNEASMRETSDEGDTRRGATSPLPRSGLPIKPPSALPGRRVTRAARATPAGGAAPGTRAAIPAAATDGVQGLALQIRPHHNGEIFLSVRAALQHPEFFRWPFTGVTVPKRMGNPAYPQLTPDPVVNITVFGQDPGPLLTLSNYALNTVYYQAKSEIRITASPLTAVVPEGSIMIFEKGQTAQTDYEITIHRPDSPDYAAWMAACNQHMPGGGKEPRRFGWF